MSDLKIAGVDDLVRIFGRNTTWTPPDTLDLYLDLVRAVIATSKYTDGYCRTDSEMISIADLQSYVRMKRRRICEHADLEECVDVAAYASMLFHKLVNSLSPEDRDRVLRSWKAKEGGD